MKQITIRDEYIRLGQAMKLAGVVDEGSEAKEMILAGHVFVNGEVETRRGRKLREGDIFSCKGEEIQICTQNPSN